jgi:hypothetical protein
MTRKSLVPADPRQLPAPEFRIFLEHFPDVWLETAKVQRVSMFAIGMAIAQHVDY